MKKTLSMLLAVVMIMAMLVSGAALADEEYVYGTAKLTWDQFWSGEDITYEEDLSLIAQSENYDTEGNNDLGGFDAVTRATSKHGIYRSNPYYEIVLCASDESGNVVYVDTCDIADIDTLEDMFGAGCNVYATANGDETVYTLAQPTDGEYTTYTINDYQVTGYKAWPVKVLASEKDAAAAAVGFVEDASVTEETGRLKTVSVDAEGNVNVSAMTAAAGAAPTFEPTVSVSYNDSYGDYIMVRLSGCDSDWTTNVVAMKYEYFGDVNPDETADAAPVATYGTKLASDFWKKGENLEIGINHSFRHGGNGETTGEEQNGYWRITVMSLGYEDYSFVVESKPAYAGEVAVTLGEDNATLTVSGVADEDWAATTVTVDGTEVTGFEGGVKTLDAALTVGDHDVIVTVDTYRDNEYTVTAMSAMTADDITLTDNTLSITDGDIATFIANTNGVSVNGETLRGANGSSIFNEDGTINFEGVVSFHGNESAVFASGSSESYELIITSAGYPTVVLTTTAA